MSSPVDRSSGDEAVNQSHLRRQAEARIAKMMDATLEVEPSEARALVHELTVYQIELEMQNEQLRIAQAELERSRSRYRELYEEAPIAYLTVGNPEIVLACNRRGGELLGVDPGTVGRRRISDFLTPGSSHVYAEHRDRLLATGTVQSFDLEMRRGKGPNFWAIVEMSAGLTEPNEPVVYRLAISDITVRKQMQDVSARLAAIVTSSDLAIISLGLDGEVTSWNPGAERLFGFPAKDIVGLTSTLLLPDDRIEEDVAMTSRVRRGEMIGTETVRCRQDGVRVPVFLTASPILDGFDRIVGISQIARDVSDQIASRDNLSQLLGELQRRDVQLQENDRRKDEFIATLAHELRNPLAPIRNAVAVLRFSGDLSPQAKWCRDVIDRQVGQMASLLEDLLDVSRITRGMVAIRWDRVSVAAAVSQAIETTQPLMESRRHQLQTMIPNERLEVAGDLTRLTQILGNLLNNAAKYTDPGGRISLTVERRESRVEIRVKDNGVGVDAEHLSKIFGLFSQVTSAIERSQGGLGIGLFLVQGLVELHGGTIEVSSDGLGKGTEFVIGLPLLPVALRDRTPDSDLRTPLPVSPSRILIADDNVDEATSLALLLRIHQYQVEVASDGEQALELAKTWKPEIVLLDLGMPKLNGYDVSRRIRAAAWGGKMVIIAYSGWGRPEDRVRSREAGIDHHISKPVAPTRLLELFASALNSRKA